MRRHRSRQLALAVFVIVFPILGNAAIKKAEPVAFDFEKVFAGCDGVLSGETLEQYAHLTAEWSLADLLNPDPAQNLAAQHPTILMNNDQLNAFIKDFYPAKKVKDPAYRNVTYNYFPLISAGVPEAGGHQIIGHFGTIQSAMKAIDDRARGKRSGKMVGFIGPAGSGKTEVLNLLSRAGAILGMTKEDYFQFTFEFKDLQEIPELRALSYGHEENGSNPITRDVTLNRSPIVLLPKHLQDKVIETAKANFVQKTKFDPIPFREPSGKTQRVIDAIVAHYQRAEGKTSVTDRDYMRWIARHTKIVRRIYSQTQPATIIRYLGKHPEMQTLFFTENLALSQYYGPKDPLSYAYGLIPSNDGSGLYVDEFFRQTGDVRDSMLDLAQNGVAQNGGAPAEKLNVTIMFATNDESIETAMQDGGAKAHLDRTIRLPMRHAIEPWHAVKIAMNDIGKTKFKMRNIDQIPDVLMEPTDIGPSRATNQFENYDPQEVFPDREDGAPLGSDGRKALYYIPDSQSKPILIAPRALWMLGLTAAGTRLVTDDKIFTKANEKMTEFHTFQKYRHLFTDPVERLKVLTGQVQVDRPVANELAKARDLLKEGQFGIGARELENWFSEALAIAANSGGALTPVVVNRAFDNILNNGKITVTPQDRPKWIAINNMVKANFILPALSSDVVNILQGQGRAEKLYDDIKLELMALSTDHSADFIEVEGNIRTPIDKVRLQEIYEIFYKLTGMAFDVGLLKDFHFTVNPASKTQRHQQLLEAVRQYLMKRELDKSTISELLEYFDGKAVSEQIRLRGSQAEEQLGNYGYDKLSFIQALIFVRDQQFELNRMRR
jgi:energy-coupling factor transporter ATP-binding protein EcfA2